MGIDGNKVADESPTPNCSHPQTAPEPVLVASAKITRRVIRDCTCRKHKKH
jgi:hypothetical protein